MRRHLPITLERFAQLQARVDEGERLPQLLAGEGLAEEVWRSAQRGWLALIGAESSQHHHELAQRYQRAYLDARPGLLAAPEKEEAPAMNAGDVDGTAMVATLDMGEALPFVAAPPPAAPPPAASHAGPPAQSPAETPAAAVRPYESAAGQASADEDERTAAAIAASRGATDETAFVSTLSEGDVLPFMQQASAAPSAAQPAAPPPALAVQLTVEQYASFCAERTANPQAAADLERRYGLPPGGAAALDASWARQFEADPALQGRFAALVAQYAGWLQQRGRGS